MPLHDWTRVSAGTCHDFHNSWITRLKEALNASLLPESYYALGEQRVGNTGPDVLALKEQTDGVEEDAAVSAATENGLVAVGTAPPRVFLAQEARQEASFYLGKRRTVVIRHVTGDRIVALVEIVSSANKHNRSSVEDFVAKVVSALVQGIHVLVIDPFPRTRHDPQGLHGLIWEELGEPASELLQDRPLTTVSYCAKSPITAYVEPMGVGMPLADMPLFLTKTHYIPTPLERTYMEAWAGVPRRWQRVITAAEDQS